MFYSRAGHKGTWLAFQKPTQLDVWLGREQVMTWTGEITISLPAPDSPFRADSMSTSAPLDGVETFRACRAWIPIWDQYRRHHLPIIGLLFTYTDGSQRCVGPVLAAPVNFHSDKIWLGNIKVPGREVSGPIHFKGIINRHVRAEKPTDDDDDYHYLELPLKWRLSWHFTRFWMAVEQYDSSEVHDEIGEALVLGKGSNTLSESEVKTFDVRVSTRC
ncbi:hypothetical protein NXS19_000298 [Fusarium pseudograminearum]|nr:hypothetical protein NXS19_000298 [Fusarium pseudograminearum]